MHPKPHANPYFHQFLILTISGPGPFSQRLTLTFTFTSCMSHPQPIPHFPALIPQPDENLSVQPLVGADQVGASSQCHPKSFLGSHACGKLSCVLEHSRQIVQERVNLREVTCFGAECVVHATYFNCWNRIRDVVRRWLKCCVGDIFS